MTKKQVALIFLLLALCAVIVLIPLLTIHDSEFGGADGAAEELVTQLDPDYEPWAESILSPPAARRSLCSSASRPPWAHWSSATASASSPPAIATAGRKQPDGALPLRRPRHA